MKITPNERQVMTACLNWAGSIWSECLADECDIALRGIPGVVSNLVKKGLVTSHGRGREATVTLTASGIRVMEEIHDQDAEDLGSVVR